MGVLATRAETIKLARELSIEPFELSFLHDVDAAELRVLRHALVNALEQPHRPMFGRLNLVTQLVPAAIIAKIAEWFFPPALCGLAATELREGKAIDLMDLLPVSYVADAAVFVDPDRAGGLIQGIAVHQISPIAATLLERKDFVTLAKFISAVTEEQLDAVLAMVTEGEQLLMSAFYAESTERFESIVAKLTDETLAKLVRAAADLGRFAEALTLMENLTPSTRSRIANIAAELGDETLAALLVSADDDEAWVEALPVVLSMTGHHLVQVAALDAWTEDRVRNAVNLCAAAGQHSEIRALVALLPDARRVFAQELPTYQSIA